MVLINLKLSEKNQFLLECAGSLTIEEIMKNLIAVTNYRQRIDDLAVAIEALVNYGPLRPEDVRGLNETANLEPDIEL